MMPTLEAVDAKIARARSELRLLRAEIAAFCQERARLIVQEPLDDGGERWVYRGDVSKAPIEWSIRAGEVAYNLRSALDHLVWQLVKANDKNPCSRNAFPIQGTRNKKIFAKRLLGGSPDVKDYIASVQPYHLEATTSGDPLGQVAEGLSLLNEICNVDKHRHLVVANARWAGFRYLNKHNFISLAELSGRVDSNLMNGNVLVDRIPGFPDHEYLEFVVDAFFDSHGWPRVNIGDSPVGETLDRCIDSVEAVVGHLRNEFS